MNRLNTALQDIASRSEAIGVSFEKLSEALNQFIEIQSKRSYKKPLKSKQIIEILKFTRI